MIISPVFEKKILLGVAGGADHQQDPNYTFDSLKASMSAKSATMEAFRVSKLLWRVLLRAFHSLQKNRGCRGARIINRIHHNNVNSLKASMVTGFAEMSREETTLLLMNSSPLQPPRLLFFWKPAKESSTGPTKTLRTPWRPTWWPHSRTCPGRRLRSPGPTTALESSTLPRQRVASSNLLSFILFYILLSWNTKKDQDNKVFLSV